MIIAIDTSIVTFALKWAINCDDSDEVSFICNRISEAVPQMQLALTVECQQRILDYFKWSDPEYLKAAPLRRLLRLLDEKRREFNERAG